PCFLPPLTPSPPTPYSLSLHAALPISSVATISSPYCTSFVFICRAEFDAASCHVSHALTHSLSLSLLPLSLSLSLSLSPSLSLSSGAHTSALHSRFALVCRSLLQKNYN